MSNKDYDINAIRQALALVVDEKWTSNRTGQVLNADRAVLLEMKDSHAMDDGGAAGAGTLEIADYISLVNPRAVRQMLEDIECAACYGRKVIRAMIEINLISGTRMVLRTNTEMDVRQYARILHSLNKNAHAMSRMYLPAEDDDEYHDFLGGETTDIVDSSPLDRARLDILRSVGIHVDDPEPPRANTWETNDEKHYTSPSAVTVDANNPIVTRPTTGFIPGSMLESYMASGTLKGRLVYPEDGPFSATTRLHYVLNILTKHFNDVAEPFSKTPEVPLLEAMEAALTKEYSRDEVLDMASLAGFHFHENPEFAPTWHANALEYSEHCFHRLAKMMEHKVFSSMPESQEPKYGIRAGRLFNRATGEHIDIDEPVFILRAKDKNAIPTLSYYASLCENERHADVILGRVADFTLFAKEYPSRMKQPDTDVLRRVTEAEANGVTPSPECPDKVHMAEHACANRFQCFEPCGDLGHSLKHARRATDIPIVLALTKGGWPVVQPTFKAGGNMQSAPAGASSSILPETPIVLPTGPVELEQAEDHDVLMGRLRSKKTRTNELLNSKRPTGPDRTVPPKLDDPDWLEYFPGTLPKDALVWLRTNTDQVYAGTVVEEHPGINKLVMLTDTDDTSIVVYWQPRDRTEKDE